MCKAVIEKVLISNKQTIKQRGYEILYLYFENLDGVKQGLHEAISVSLTQKNPKIVCQSIGLVVELLTQYGIVRMNYLKGFIPEMEKLADSQQTVIKNEALRFFKEAAKWLGTALPINNLKKNQQDEIRAIISENHHMKPLKLADSDDLHPLHQPASIDAYEIADPVECFAKFSEQWCEKVVQMPKWSERKDELELLLKAVSVVRIQPPAPYHITQALKKYLNDKNMIVSNLALKVIGAMASGLRKHFN